MYLNCHTYYSLRYGTMSERTLLEQAQNHGVKTIAVTDINNSSVIINVLRMSRELDVKVVPGIDFRNGVDQQFIGIARTNEGYLALNSFLSYHLHAHLDIPRYAPPLTDTYIIYPLRKVLGYPDFRLQPNEYIGVGLHERNKINLLQRPEWKNRLVVLHPVSFEKPKDYNTHRLLRAIDNNTLLSKLPISEQGDEREIMLPIEKINEAFQHFPNILRNTEEILETSQVEFDFSDQRITSNLRSYTSSEKEDEVLIRELCEEGLYYRYPNDNGQAKARMEKELDLIKKMRFVSFFLVNWDILSYAREQGFFYIGRGSGANSIVAYLLRITDVDPMELDLYFERFMNLFRRSPPDFDIDFSWRDRQVVTKYIFDRFGKTGQVALLATYNTFQKNAAIRELGKVFGLPNEEISKLSRGSFKEEDLDRFSKLVLIYANRILGLPNYRSIHAGGVVISQRPIHYYTATDMPPKGFPTTHFDMYTAEDVGLYKLDILGQRGLAKIKDAVEMIKDTYDPSQCDFDIHDVSRFMKDSRVNALIKEARCLGCFYVESPAMRMLLKKLEVDNYLGLVAASSIIRPGVAKSGMMREYILRHKYPERRKNAHPILLDIMPETYGVMVYQEDVIKVAYHFAGLDLGEADVLRRAMSGKFRSRLEFERVRDKFINNCRDKGHTESMIRDIWYQIESFAGYAFAKGHSASYAVESYQCLFLKAYFPLEYMVAVINNGGGFYRTEIYVHELRMLGGMIHAPCVNTGFGHTTIRGKDITLGLQLLAQIESNTIVAIIEEREKHGQFHSLMDFLNRVSIEIKQLDILIRVGAFRFTGQDKRRLLWESHYIWNQLSRKKTLPNLLFRMEPNRFELPNFTTDWREEAFDQMELLGFPLCSPYNLLRESPELKITVKDFQRFIGKEVAILGYLVSIKNTRTSRGDRMQFGTFFDIKGAFIDTVHYPNVVRQYPFSGMGVYRIMGRVVEEFNFLSLEVHQMEKLPYIDDPRYSDS